MTTPYDEVKAELLGVVENAIDNHPRSLQTRIGPSEIGHPCARRLAYKLAGMPDVNQRRTPWKPTIGTATHTWMDETFTKANESLPGYERGEIRYWTEVRVDVGEILGEPVTGSCDLRFANVALDYKIVGDQPLRNYKANGPGPQYRIQGHLYGRGWQRRGQPVTTVAIWFLPRNQELRQNYLWTEPYDEQIAIDALKRVEAIAQLASQAGVAAATLLPATEAYCSLCPYFQAGSIDVTQGCPGAITPRDPAKEFAGLIASQPTT